MVYDFFKMDKKKILMSDNIFSYKNMEKKKIVIVERESFLENILYDACSVVFSCVMKFKTYVEALR